MVPASCHTLVREMVRLSRPPAPSFMPSSSSSIYLFLHQGPSSASEVCSELRAHVQCLASDETAGAHWWLHLQPTLDQSVRI